jgi:capsular exopolysaccharide synthesis family protein
MQLAFGATNWHYPSDAKGNLPSGFHSFGRLCEKHYMTPSELAPRNPVPSAPGGGWTSDAGAVLKALRRSWALLAAAVIFCVGAALLYSKSQPAIYEASTLVEMNPQPVQPLGEKETAALDMGAGLFFDTQEYYQTEYRIVTSDRVLGAVVRDLSLASDFSFLGYKSPPSAPVGVEIATAALRGRTTVEPVKNSRLFNIKVEDTDPTRARRLSDAIASAFIEQNLQTAITSSSEALVWLTGQLDHVKQELDRDENSLYDFKQKHGLPSTSINEASNMLRVEMQEYDMALTRTRTRKQELLARHKELSQITPENPDEIPSSELLSNAYLQQLRTEYQQLVRDRGALAAEGKGDNHPLVKSLVERIEKTRSALLAEVRKIQAAVALDLSVIENQEAGEAALFEEARRRAVELNMKEIEYHRLDRSREENEKVFELLSNKMKEADLARMMRVNNIRIVDPAEDPGGPVRPRVSVNVGIGMLAGLVLGLGLAWLRDFLDNTLKTPQDIEAYLGVTFLGLLPELTDDGAGKRRSRRRAAYLPASDPNVGHHVELVVHEHPLSGIAEAARSIRTNLMFMNPDRPYRRLLVSSAAPEEGKTTVACSIAIALAQGGQRVCIVDCDLRRPRIHRIFDRAGDAGIMNMIVGEATVDEVAKPTLVQNLWAIPAGPVPPNPADVLHSEKFRKLLDELSERFDRIVIDSPPIAAVTDSAVMSTLVDGTVFVVRASKTSKQLARQGLRILQDVDSGIVGAVLNAVDLSNREYGYYHYYYYKRYGYKPITVRSDDAEPSERPPAPN